MTNVKDLIKTMTPEQAIEIITNSLQANEEAYTQEVDIALYIIQKFIDKNNG